MDFTREKIFSVEKKVSPIFDTSLAVQYNSHPQLIKIGDPPESIMNKDSCSLNLSASKNGMMKIKPLESKIKNVLKRLRVGIRNDPHDKKIKKQKSDSLMQQVPITNPVIKTEPIHKNLLDLKVKDVIKRLRVGIIKDLNDKDPVDLTRVKKELKDSMKEMMPNESLDCKIKMEFEEDCRLNLDIVKHESVAEKTTSIRSSTVEGQLPKKNYSLSDVVRCDSLSGRNVVNSNTVKRKSFEKNFLKIYDDAIVVKEFPEMQSVDITKPLVESSGTDIVSAINVEKVLLNFNVNKNLCLEDNTAVLNFLNTPTEKCLSNLNLVENETVKSNKDRKLVSLKSVINEIEIKATSSVNLKTTEKKLSKKKKKGLKILGQKVCKKKMFEDVASKINIVSVSDDVNIFKEESSVENVNKKIEYDKVGEKNSLQLNDAKNKFKEGNSLILKIFRKKGSKTGKLEVQMIEKISKKKNFDVLLDGEDNILDAEKCVENKKSVYGETNKNGSFVPESDNKMATSKLIENCFINQKKSIIIDSSAQGIDMLPAFNLNSDINFEKGTTEEGEFIPTDILQTEMQQSLTCVICKNSEVVTFNENSEQKDLFICKSCKKLLDKDKIKEKLDGIRTEVECNILNVTCFKCNLSFSSAEEIELHNETHKNDNCDKNIPINMGKNIKPQFCRLCHTGINISTNQICVHLRKRRHKCQYCFKLFLSKSDLRKHVNIHTREIMYDCKLCDKSFSCRSNLRKHLEIHDDKRERIYKCEYCDKSFYKPDHLKVHVNVHTNEKLYECPYCNKTYTRKYCLQLHINIHTLEKIYECTFCHKICMDRSTLRKHMALHSEESPYKCNYCERAFKQKTQLDAHTNIHTLSKLFFCDHCNKSFRNKTNLRKHIEIHMGNKEAFLCLFCNKSYSSKSNLWIHINRHTNLKSYDCTFCPKSFKDPSTLKKHINIHTKEKKYQCADCDKIFIRKSHLRNHINSHMGIKSIKCEDCGKSFAQRSYLKVHIENTHQGIKRFCCKICNKWFKTKINLDVHMNTHTREKLFHCSYCKKVCTQKANLQTHIFKYHTDQIKDDFTL